jgi:zinc transporter 5/7
MADTLGSVGVIISTLLINRYRSRIRLNRADIAGRYGWTGFDPLASIFIAVLIFASVVPLVQDSGMLLCLDLGPNREEEVRKALSELSTIEGLSSCAAPRFWPMDPDTLVGSIHIQLTPSPSSHDPSRPHAPNHYHNVDRVVARVDAALRKSIPGLGTLDIQVEGADGLASCHCLT